ncbi:MAG: hypothetical protein D6675_00645 [Gemmatimonadetes bacterium]|nr:MAG: hypothetical protein D6675_00645 [Gemmatimonadota bacterium]
MFDWLRRKTKVFIIIVTVAFIATIFLVWGMNLRGMSGSAGAVSPTTPVGKINGEKVELQQFGAQYERNVSERAQQRDGELTDQDYAQIQEQTWEQFVREYLIEQAVKEHKIQVSNEEVVDYMLNNPPQSIRENEQFQDENGEFSLELYQNYLATLDANILASNEAYYRQLVLPRVRLQNMLESAVRVTELELKEAYLAQNLKVTVEYVAFRPRDLLPNDSVEVTDDEIQAYYEAHKEDYKVGEQAILSYVLFNAEQEAKAEIDRIYAEATQPGADFAALAREYSQDPGSGARGGDLNWFGKGRMVKPFEDAAFALEPGEISQPVKSQFGWHIIKMDSVRTTDNGEKEVRARHILIKTDPTEEQMQAFQQKAKEFAEKAKSGDFAAIAAEMGLTIEETKPFENNVSGFVGGVGRVPEVVEFAFANKVGDVSDPVNQTRGVYVFQIKERLPERVQDIEEVRPQIESSVKFEKQQEFAKAKAEEFLERLKTEGKDLQTLAAEMDSLPYEKPEPFAKKDFVRGVGRGNEFIWTAFELPVGEISDVITIENRGSYILKVLDRDEFDPAKFAEEKDAIREQLLARRQGLIFNHWYESQKKDARIEENIEKYFSLN